MGFKGQQQFINDHSCNFLKVAFNDDAVQHTNTPIGDKGEKGGSIFLAGIGKYY